MSRVSIWPVKPAVASVDRGKMKLFPSLPMWNAGENNSGWQTRVTDTWVFHWKLLNYYEHWHGTESVTRSPASTSARSSSFFAFTGKNTFTNVKKKKKQRIERGNRSVIFFNNFLRKCRAFIEFKGRTILTACHSLSLSLSLSPPLSIFSITIWFNSRVPSSFVTARNKAGSFRFAEKSRR